MSAFNNYDKNGKYIKQDTIAMDIFIAVLVVIAFIIA